MKKLNRVQLFLAALLFSSLSFSQSPVGNYAVHSPGNNSCNAVELWSDGFNYSSSQLNFPVPAGLKVNDLNWISTDYFELLGTIRPFCAWFEFIVQSSCGAARGVIYLGSQPGTGWKNTGNILDANTTVEIHTCDGADVISYSTFQSIYGNDPVTEIYLGVNDVFFFNGDVFRMMIDNTRFNETIFNYDDCDNNDIPDDFECTNNNNMNEKMQICHNGQTICIPQSTSAFHFAHGDILGACFEVSSRAATGITEPATVKDYSISCYPNPIGQLTKIQFTLPASAGVSIKVYDVTGREVSQLFKGEKVAGTHSLYYNTSALGTGIYYCRMLATSGDKEVVITYKMVKVE